MVDLFSYRNQPLRSDYAAARRIIRTLPALPSSIRYLDEYNDTMCSIRNPAESHEWELCADTEKAVICFSKFDQDVSFMLKHFFLFSLSYGSTYTTIYIYKGFSRIVRHSGANWLLEAVERSPLEWSAFWVAHVKTVAQQDEAFFYKRFLHFMCNMALGKFRPEYGDFIKSLPFDWKVSYQGISNGESIINVNQEQNIIKHLDGMSQCLRDNPNYVGDEVLVKASLLCISYQHGLRPVQICRIDSSDLRIHSDESGQPIVHFTAYRAKKLQAREKTPFTRRIKPDWAPLFVEYQKRRDHGLIWRGGENSEGKLFAMSKQVLIKAIGDIVEEVTGIRSTATILRHSAAQRMADGGASIEEIAEFLGHSNHDTSLVYIEASPAQAERLNQALSVSPIYTRIAEVARTGTIDKAALLVFRLCHLVPTTALRLARARSTFSRISLVVAVQVKGLGWSLCSAR